MSTDLLVALVTVVPTTVPQRPAAEVRQASTDRLAYPRQEVETEISDRIAEASIDLLPTGFEAREERRLERRSLGPSVDRPRIERSHGLSSPSWLTRRDDAICLDLQEHRVLTTPQIADLHFEDVRRARGCLLTFHRKRVLERFRPYRPTGSAPHHYMLGEVGARVVAATRGLDLKTVRQRMERDLYLVFNPRLNHLLEI